MSRSYWLSVFAAFGIALATAVSAQPVGDNTGGQPRADQADQQPKADASPLRLDAIERELARIARSAEAQNNEADAKKKEEREESDLKAQWQMARWAENAFYVAVGALVLTIVGVFLIWRTLVHTHTAAVAARDMVTEGEKATTAALEATKEAKRQADFAEESFRRIERPYLFVKITETLQIRNVAPQGFAGLSYTLANYGKTPAILRSVAVGLQDSPSFPLRTPMAIEDKTYAVIEPGGALVNGRTVRVSGDENMGKRYGGTQAKGLVLHGYLGYEDATGAYYFDKFCLRGLPGGSAFEIDGGEEHNSRTTTYPKPKTE